MSDQYNILLQDDEMTVVSHYTVEYLVDVRSHQ